MNASSVFETVCLAFADPAFYPHPVSGVERLDTHISAVFLTGRWVYKLKKSVNFGFLDFRTLEARKYFCEMEILLNRRLSQDIYDAAVPVYMDADGRISLEPKGNVVEYAVRMKQLSDERCMASMLLDDRVSADQLADLGKYLADFYARSERNPEIDAFGSIEKVGFNVEENFQQVAPYVEGLLNPHRWEHICKTSRTFLRGHRNLFQKRIRAGRICDGHGDLRTEHVYFQDGIQILDCIEFNDRFRYGDVAVDLAFLHMDMEYREYSEKSQELLYAYVDQAEDPQLYAVLDFYSAYRAVVRLKVSCFTLDGLNPEAAASLKKAISRYQDLAYEYALRFSRPTLWVFCGLPATGKSSLAQEIQSILDITWLQSDKIRRQELSQAPDITVYGQGIYRPESRDLIYRRLLEEAGTCLKSGRSVIVDATFSRSRWRENALQIARESESDILFVECRCSEDEIVHRLRQREITQGLSDARLQHLPDMIREFEPMETIREQYRITIDAQGAVSQTVHQIVSQGYDRKCARIKQLVKNPA